MPSQFGNPSCRTPHGSADAIGPLEQLLRHTFGVHCARAGVPLPRLTPRRQGRRPCGRIVPLALERCGISGFFLEQPLRRGTPFERRRQWSRGRCRVKSDEERPGFWIQCHRRRERVGDRGIPGADARRHDRLITPARALARKAGNAYGVVYINGRFLVAHRSRALASAQSAPGARPRALQ